MKKKRDLSLKKQNLKVSRLKTVYSAHCADDSVLLPYINFVSFQLRGI